MVEGDLLRLAPIRLRAKFPLRIAVVARQFGRATAPRLGQIGGRHTEFSRDAGRYVCCLRNYRRGFRDLGKQRAVTRPSLKAHSSWDSGVPSRAGPSGRPAPHAPGPHGPQSVACGSCWDTRATLRAHLVA
jgi:hypothetical protein